MKGKGKGNERGGRGSLTLLGHLIGLGACLFIAWGLTTVPLLSSPRKSIKPVSGDIPILSNSQQYLSRLGPPPIRFEKKEQEFDRKDLIPLSKAEELKDKDIVRKNGKIIPEFLLDYTPSIPQLTPPLNAPLKTPVVISTLDSSHNAPTPSIPQQGTSQVDSIQSISSIIEKTFQQSNDKKVKLLIPFDMPYQANRQPQESTTSSATFIKR
ncbi:MAG: hypothetical protein A2007_04215 [Verrucomicrobia bacterium GWC2_42_7]|nr:MAG: hypothetical protein A2007_04215 [Verrucomicrobia bacterium GWC2_42_7]